MLKDMTHSIARLGMQSKEKSVAIVAGPFTNYRTGDTIAITGGEGRQWKWRVVDGMEALGTYFGWTYVAAPRLASGMELQKQTLCSTLKCPHCATLKFGSRGAYTHSSPRVLLQHYMVRVNGQKRSQCSRRCVFGNWASSGVFYTSTEGQTRPG